MYVGGKRKISPYCVWNLPVQAEEGKRRTWTQKSWRFVDCVRSLQARYPWGLVAYPPLGGRPLPLIAAPGDWLSTRVFRSLRRGACKTWTRSVRPARTEDLTHLCVHLWAAFSSTTSPTSSSFAMDFHDEQVFRLSPSVACEHVLIVDASQSSSDALIDVVFLHVAESAFGGNHALWITRLRMSFTRNARTRYEHLLHIMQNYSMLEPLLNQCKFG